MHSSKVMISNDLNFFMETFKVAFVFYENKLIKFLFHAVHFLFNGFLNSFEKNVK